MRHKLSEYLDMKKVEIPSQTRENQTAVLEAVVINHEEDKPNQYVGQGEAGKMKDQLGSSQMKPLRFEVPDIGNEVEVVAGCSNDIIYMTTRQAAGPKNRETASSVQLLPSSLEDSQALADLITDNELIEGNGQDINSAAIDAVNTWLISQCSNEICVASKNELRATLSTTQYLHEKINTLEQERDRYKFELVNERYQHEMLKNVHVTATGEIATKEHETALKMHTEALQKLAQDFQQLKEHNDAKLAEITVNYSEYQKFSEAVQKMEGTVSANSEGLQQVRKEVKGEKADNAEFLNKIVNHLFELKKKNDAEMEKFLKQLGKCKLLIARYCCKKGDEIRCLNESWEKYKSVFESWKKEASAHESIRMQSIKAEIDSLKSEVKESQAFLQQFHQGVRNQFANSLADLNNVGAQVYELQRNVGNIVRVYETWRNKEFPAMTVLSQQVRQINSTNAEKFANITKEIGNLKQDRQKSDEVLTQIENLRGKVIEMEKNLEGLTKKRKDQEENGEDNVQSSRKRKLTSQRKLTASPDIGGEETTRPAPGSNPSQELEGDGRIAPKKKIVDVTDESNNNTGNDADKDSDSTDRDETSKPVNRVKPGQASKMGSHHRTGYSSVKRRTDSVKITKMERVCTRSRSRHTIVSSEKKSKSVRGVTNSPKLQRLKWKFSKQEQN